MKYENVEMFGGGGYIAGFIVNYSISESLAGKVYLVDRKPPRM